MLLVPVLSPARRILTRMTRRLHSPSSPRLAKRPRLDCEPLTSEDYKDGIMLAPMVRSGALLTRLFALKHGASLVWGPEVVDKAILHAERVVDPATGVVSYEGKSKAIFTTHPIEKPYLIYQIGSADPELAVQAAKTVMHDVSGVDLNCGCPKPFSTHSGMGAALLTNPDLLCSILTALRAALPPEITVSAKIRLLPTQEDTLKLVERIINTGVSALTVHCRTRNMRARERAVIERLREIVEFVEGMGRGVAVIENGDCVGYEDAKRIRELTGAHSVMIATAAEANPTCFSPTPLADLDQTFIPSYIRLGKYLNNHWTNTKYCAMQFEGPHVKGHKNDAKRQRELIVRSKNYDELDEHFAPWNGEEEFAAIVAVIESRGGRRKAASSTTAAVPVVDITTEGSDQSSQLSETSDSALLDAVRTPPLQTGVTDPSVLNAPLAPANEMRIQLPAAVTQLDDLTPTPTPKPAHV